ncbi:Phospholipid-transporting ATPase 1 [Vitis vinifera]|uniref:Phospholipid-transporting ATPase 1 n=1 Tax=Vitis vinifera TaxID=29760 RepID=A0A438IVW4_VITVI|nr:Phospholipid-transporting ATPase 1 [Vitis vinifera]
MKTKSSRIGWYILSTAFSTTSALTDLSSVFYSLIYTSIPTIVVGILDKDLNDETLLQYPRLYGAGHRQESYNMRLFWITMIDTLWQSLVIFYIPVFIYSDSSIDIWSMGSLWTITVVILVNVHLAMDVQRWIFITHVAVWGSIIITYACLIAVDSIPIFPNYGYTSEFWPSDIQIAREAEILGDQPDNLPSKSSKGSG